jgi:hypothetical protein
MGQQNADLHTLAAHNVVAAFEDAAKARSALDALRQQGFADDELSFVSRDPGAAPVEGESFEESADVSDRLVGGATKGGLAGGGIGGLAGFLAGALAFGIPGIGPAVGAGIWIATGAGAAAGATAGGLIGGFSNIWDMRYRDMVRDGRVLLGAHSDDEARANEAYAVLLEFHPVHLAHFDTDGVTIHEA